MKRSKELSKQDKDGNPIWLKPERSKELERLLFHLLDVVTGDPCEPSKRETRLVRRAITAIEKWAKEKYGKKKDITDEIILPSDIICRDENR